MTNEEKAARIEEFAIEKAAMAAMDREFSREIAYQRSAKDFVIRAERFDRDAIILREAAQLMREREVNEK
jgi:hypothetical protein